MNKTNIILLITCSIIILVLLLLLLYRYYNDKINELLKKINKSEKQELNKLKEKQNILIRAINLIENKLDIKSKTFDDVRKLKIDSLTTFKDEEILNKCFNEILDIKEHNSKSKKLKTLDEIINDYNENELHVISLRSYYNKYTMKYNCLIKKLPYNIIAKIKKYKLKLLLEGLEIEKE